MTIASQLEALTTNLAAAKGAVTAKGGTVGDTGLAGLASEIGTIPTGGSFVGIPRDIDANGKLVEPQISSYSLPAGVSDIGDFAFDEAFHSDTYIQTLNMSGLTAISGNNACTEAFLGCTNLTSVDMSNVVNITGTRACYGMFEGCTSLASVNLGKLETIDESTNGNGAQRMFYGCTSLQTVDISKLNKAYGPSVCYSMFEGCTNLTTVKLDSLATIGGGTNGYQRMFYGCSSLVNVSLPLITELLNNMSFNSAFRGCTSLASNPLSNLEKVAVSSGLSNTFYGCTSLVSVSFPKLELLGGAGNIMNGCFYNCTSLTTLSFPALETISGNYTNLFNDMLKGCSNVTVHFKSDLQSVIGSWSSVTSGFSGTNTTVLFDL